MTKEPQYLLRIASESHNLFYGSFMGLSQEFHLNWIYVFNKHIWESPLDVLHKIKNKRKHKYFTILEYNRLNEIK